MPRYVNKIVFLFLSISCCFCVFTSKAKPLNLSLNFIGHTKTEAIDTIDGNVIRTLLYPYSINIVNDSIIVTRRYLFSDEEYRGKLTDEQHAEIKKMVSALSQKYEFPSEIALGGRTCILEIDNQVHYKYEGQNSPLEFSDPKYSSMPKEMKVLFQYIVDLSPISYAREKKDDEAVMPETRAQPPLQDTRDGKKYKTVKIGTQVWMAENLNYNAEDSKCYDNKAENCEKYGRLYNWETAMQACPEGWHLPSKEEWDVLMKAVGGAETTGEKLKAKNGWKERQSGSGNGTDEYGFSALPGGFGHSEKTKAAHREYERNYDRNFDEMSRSGYWWTSSESSSNYAYYLNIYYERKDAAHSSYDKSFLYSIRCLQGNGEARLPNEAHAQPPTPLHDARDGKKYKTVRIWKQTWMAENLNYNAEGSACYENKPENCEKYGRLYNLETALKICPEGWRLPNDDDWDILITAMDEETLAGTKLKAKSGWNEWRGSSGNGTDEYGFSALPGGRGSSDDKFYYIGERGYWLSSSKRHGGVCYQSMNWNGYIGGGCSDKSLKSSIRCLQNYDSF